MVDVMVDIAHYRMLQQLCRRLRIPVTGALHEGIERLVERYDEGCDEMRAASHSDRGYEEMEP